jgi:hypothetical protein
MEALHDIQRTLGRIEGRLDELCKLAERVRQLEAWQWWLKGGWAALAAGYAYLFTTGFGK